MSLKRKGVTLVEIMIVVALSCVVGYGLFQMIKLTTQIIWTSGAKLELQQNAQEAMYWISNDLKSSQAASIGCVNLNPGFEIPMDAALPTGPALGWQYPQPGDVTKISSVDTNLKSGFYAVKLQNVISGATYNSNISTFPLTGTYIFSGWIKADGPSEMRLLRDNGSNFTPEVVIGCVAATGTWQYFQTALNQNAGVRFKIRLSSLNSGITAYFDDVSVAHQEIVLNSASLVNEFRYDKFMQMKNDLYRLYYDSATFSLYRQLWNGSNWVTQSPEPLSKYLKQLTIKNPNQRNFAVILELAKTSQRGKEEIYLTNTSVTPLTY